MLSHLITRISLCALLVLTCIGVAGAQSLDAIQVYPASVTGGDRALLVVTLDKDAPKGGEVVTLSSDNTAATVVASVKVFGGHHRAEAVVHTVVVATDTTVTLTGALNGVSKTATLIVKAVKLEAILAPHKVKGGKKTIGGVELSGFAPMGGLVVTLSSDKAAVVVPASVTVAAGHYRAEFPITTSSVTAATMVTLTATLNGVTKTTNITVEP